MLGESWVSNVGPNKRFVTRNLYLEQSSHVDKEIGWKGRRGGIGRIWNITEGGKQVSAVRGEGELKIRDKFAP